VDYLASNGHQVVCIEGVGVTPEAVQQTQAAMKAGVEIIVQATLCSGRWAGGLTFSDASRRRVRLGIGHTRFWIRSLPVKRGGEPYCNLPLR